MRLTQDLTLTLPHEQSLLSSRGQDRSFFLQIFLSSYSSLQHAAVMTHSGDICLVNNLLPRIPTYSI